MLRLILNICVLCLLVAFSCKKQKEGRGSSNQKVKLKSKVQDTNYYLDTTILIDGGYKIVVISNCLNDTLNSEKSFYINPICIEQKLFLYRDNTLLVSKKHDLGTDIVTTTRGVKVKVLKNVISTINLRKGKNGDYFWIRGTGGCSWCITYHEVFDLNGNSIYLLIEDKKNIYNKIGNLESIMKQNGITDQITEKEKSLEKHISSKFEQYR